MSDWIVYTHGTQKYLEKIKNTADTQGSDFEWKIEGNILYFRPKYRQSYSINNLLRI